MFHSTRGKKLVTSQEAILNGLAEDGGLYITDDDLKLDYKTLINDDYNVMAAKVLHVFFPEFSFDDLLKEVKDGYSSFDTKNVCELKGCDDAYFLELFHGPTLAFKDLALVILPRLMKLSKKKLGYEKNITILTATSGDTGGAALNGFKDIEGISIVVLYPNGGVSPVQEAQMCSFRGSNAKVLAINGNFDDCQNFVKEFFNNHKELSLSSANSINIARLVPQVVYYFYSYVKLLNDGKIKDGEKINFCVPTGNFGDIFAGFYAKMLGLPINDLICASNKNRVLTDFFNNNLYDKNRDFYRTNSPSMDILISSNLERMLYYGLNNDTEKTKNLMKDLQSKGKYEYKNNYDFFKAYSTDEKETLKTIKYVYDKYNYLIDPHTAVAYNAYKLYKEEYKNDYITVINSTASPYKFPQSVLEAFNIEEKDAHKACKIINEKFGIEIPARLNYPEVVREVVNLKDTDNYVVELIKCFK